MYQFGLIIFSCLLLFCQPKPLFASISTQHVHPSIKTYLNEEKKFFIEYPSNWIRVTVEPSTIDLVLLAPPSSANINIVAESADECPTLDQAYSEAVSAFINCELDLKSGDLELNGIPSKWIFSSYVHQGVEIHVLQYLIVVQEMQYVISFGASSEDFGSYYSEFEKIMDSFRLL